MCFKIKISIIINKKDFKLPDKAEFFFYETLNAIRTLFEHITPIICIFLSLLSKKILKSSFKKLQVVSLET